LIVVIWNLWIIDRNSFKCHPKNEKKKVVHIQSVSFIRIVQSISRVSWKFLDSISRS
jgi:hypothetical protein